MSTRKFHLEAEKWVCDLPGGWVIKEDFSVVVTYVSC